MLEGVLQVIALSVTEINFETVIKVVGLGILLNVETLF